jgi:hypothetical protein
MFRGMSLVFFMFLIPPAGIGYGLANFGLIGFSESGEYFAWEQHGTNDPTGFPWCEIGVMHVPSGETIATIRIVIDLDLIEPDSASILENLWSEGNPDRPSWLLWEDAAIDQANEEASPLIDSLGIDRDNTGRLCVHHPLTDMSLLDTEVRFATGMYGPEYPASPVFEVILENREVTGLDEKVLLQWITPPQVLQLAVRHAHDQTLTVLVDDEDTGDESHFSYWYSLRDVITWRDEYVVMVLRRSDPGFEGPDTRFRVVTGELPEFSPVWSYSSKG